MANHSIKSDNIQADYDEYTDQFPKPITGFDVTCVIGRVEFSDTGESAPRVVAFAMIGEHDVEGTYSFPMADGRTCVVDVNHYSGKP